MSHVSEIKIFAMGNSNQVMYNKKMCFEARDSLFDCVDSMPNKNKLCYCMATKFIFGYYCLWKNVTTIMVLFVEEWV